MFKALLLVSLLPVCALAAPGEAVPSIEVNGLRDAEWVSYRHAYKSSAFFAPFLRTRPLIQAHLQIRPLQPGASLDGLRLRLAGAHQQVDIDVDAIGRAVIPMDTQSYQDDAVLTLNRGKGRYYVSGRYSIREHADGMYQMGELRQACEQLISAQRASGYRMRLIGKSCAGIKLVYPLGSAPLVSIGEGEAARTLPSAQLHPFEDNSMDLYQVVQLRFADFPADALIKASTLPIAIGTLYE